MTRTVSRTLTLGALLALLLGAMPAGAARIVSLNLCADDYLVLLAPEQVAALSPLARDPALSVVAEAAQRLPVVRRDAEAVLELAPDLVVAGVFGAQTTLALLEQRGLHVLRLASPTDFAGIRAQTRMIAGVLGVPDRGERLIAEMDALLALPVTRQPAETALLLQARGYTSGPGSLGHEVLLAAGYEDAGTRKHLGLEALVARPPDLLIIAQPPDFPSIGTDFVRHPALAGIPRRTLPPAWLLCAGPWSARAVRWLAR